MYLQALAAMGMVGSLSRGADFTEIARALCRRAL